MFCIVFAKFTLVLSSKKHNVRCEKTKSPFSILTAFDSIAQHLWFHHSKTLYIWQRLRISLYHCAIVAIEPYAVSRSYFIQWRIDILTIQPLYGFWHCCEISFGKLRRETYFQNPLVCWITYNKLYDRFLWNANPYLNYTPRKLYKIPKGYANEGEGDSNLSTNQFNTLLS